MGSFISRTKLVVGGAYILNQLIGVLAKRLKESPGIPVENPTVSFWTIPKAKITSQPVPQHADVVVVGSGITGTSFAYNALKLDESLRIVMLEARDICSGATGRNGGHVNPPLYQDYAQIKESFGLETAKKTVRFRLAHIREFLTVAGFEDIVEHSQCREVDNLDIYFSKETFAEVKADLEAWKADMPEEAKSWVAVEGDVAAKMFGLSSEVAGCIHGDGGAMHPYRFVTALQSKLLARHNNFTIATHTPCTSIDPPSHTQPFYTLTTPNGIITATHIVHATNAWTSHLLTPMREKIIPVRGTMTAQRPGAGLKGHTLDGLRTYVFNGGAAGYDYLTQLPSGEHEMMFGGGALSNLTSGLGEDLACADDSRFSLATAGHVSGILPFHFGLDNWGKEKECVPELQEEEDDVEWMKGRTKAVWSGILGFSADGYPWVGRLPPRISGRNEPASSRFSARNPPSSKSWSGYAYEKLSDVPQLHTARPGEWIAAGFTGEGMPQAWLSAKALVYMVLDREDEVRGWFPDNLRVTEERWKKADVADLIMRRAG